MTAEIARIEQEVSATAPTGGSLTSPTGFVVSGGGIGTLLGASITVSGGSHVDGNLSGVQVPAGNPQVHRDRRRPLLRPRPDHRGASTVSGNTSLGGGGGIWNRGSLTAFRGAIAGNTAAQSPGGGLYNSAGGTASILRSIIRANRASLGGGIANKGHLTLARTHIVANTPDNIASPA